MFFNGYYLLFMLPGLLLTLWAQAKVKGTFGKFSHVRTLNGLTGAQAARRILDANGLQNVPVRQVAGHLNDHYDPRQHVVCLSDATYASPTVAAVGVAAHEVGHAVQHALGHGPARIRTAIVPLCNVGSRLAAPAIILGFVLNMLGLIYLGIALFSLAVLFQLVTLPVEFDASRRAMQTLSSGGMMTAEEVSGARKVLSAAAFTYVAAMLTSLLQLVYYIGLAGRRR